MTTLTVHASALDAKIAARNLVHTNALHYWPAIIAALEPFVGEKIQNTDGQLSKKIKSALPNIGHDASLRGLSAVDLNCWYSTGAGYSLTAHFKTCQSSQGRSINGRSADYNSAYYEECTVYLGELRNGVLLNICEPPTLRTDYTAEEINICRSRLADAKRYVGQLESALGSFGEYDH